MMTLSIERIYEESVRGRSPGDRMRLLELIAHDLGGPRPAPSTAPTDRCASADAVARLRRHAGSVSLGHATGADNGTIDADLA
ncbi:MAG: hypothetical protein NT029_18250 [Armatimonadetes bacterium]|nr:hypothetical protein [Armatimonadota bacterium]